MGFAASMNLLHCPTLRGWLALRRGHSIKKITQLVGLK